MKRTLLATSLVLLSVSTAWSQNYAVKPAASDGILFVSPNGSNSNDGLSWGSAKLSIGGTNGALTQCTTNAPSGPCTIHVSAGGSTIASTVKTTVPTTITCEPGAELTVTSGVSGEAIDIESSDSRVTGCNFVPGTSETAVPLYVGASSSVSRVSIDHNTFGNASAAFASGNGVVQVNLSTNSSSVSDSNIIITENHFAGNTIAAVNVQDQSSHIVVSNNVIHSGSSSTSQPLINVQTSSSGTTATSIAIVGNAMINGLENNCVQVQKLSGNAPTDVTVSGNSCTLASTGVTVTGTGYSISGAGQVSLTGNVFDAATLATAGTPFHGGNDPFEATASSQVTEAGNNAIMGSQDLAQHYSIFAVGGDGATTDAVVTGNSVSMSVTGTTSGIGAGCFHITTSAAVTVQNVTVSGNLCDLSGSSSTQASLRGVWVQANNTSAVVRNIAVSGNTLLGTTGNSTNIAVDGEVDAGTASGVEVGTNTYVGWSQDRNGHVNAALTGTATLSSGSVTVTFPNGITYDAAPACTANESGGTNALKVTSATTSITVKSSSTTDTSAVGWSCQPAQSD